MTAQMVRADDFARVFHDTIAVVRHEVPEAFDRFVAALGDITVDMQVGGDRFGLHRAQVIAHRRGPGSPSPRDDVTLQIESHALIALVEGTITLTEALAARSLNLIGTTSDLGAVEHAFLLLVHGAVRSRSPQALLDRLTLAASRSPANDTTSSPLPTDQQPPEPASSPMEDSP